VRNSPLPSLKKYNDFQYVFKHGKSAAMPLFVVYAAKNNLGYSRLGLSVSKKVGNAIVRNRVRRLVKECFRCVFSFPPDSAGVDFIVIARAPAGELPRVGSFDTVCKTLSKLLGRLGVST
jgi:ribonuclease P protein component